MRKPLVSFGSFAIWLCQSLPWAGMPGLEARRERRTWGFQCPICHRWCLVPSGPPGIGSWSREASAACQQQVLALVR